MLFRSRRASREAWYTWYTQIKHTHTHTHTHTQTHTIEYYSAIKNNEILPFAATSVDLEIIVLSEVSQTEKDKYYMISLVCGI